MENKKISDKEFFENVISIMTTGEATLDPQEMIEKAQQKIASIERKAERAKELRAEKRAAGDELLELVKACLTNDWNIAANIAAEISEKTGETFSRQKISARLTKLVKDGFAVESDMILTKENGKKNTAKSYKLAD